MTTSETELRERMAILIRSQVSAAQWCHREFLKAKQRDRFGVSATHYQAQRKVHIECARELRAAVTGLESLTTVRRRKRLWAGVDARARQREAAAASVESRPSAETPEAANP